MISLILLTQKQNPEGLEAIASSGNSKQRSFVLVRAGSVFSQLLLLPSGSLRAGSECSGFISAGLRLLNFQLAPASVNPLTVLYPRLSYESLLVIITRKLWDAFLSKKREVEIPMCLSESCMSVLQKCVWCSGLEILI